MSCSGLTPATLPHNTLTQLRPATLMVRPRTATRTLGDSAVPSDGAKEESSFAPDRRTLCTRASSSSESAITQPCAHGSILQVFFGQLSSHCCVSNTLFKPAGLRGRCRALPPPRGAYMRPISIPRRRWNDMMPGPAGLRRVCVRCCIVAS